MEETLSMCLETWQSYWGKGWHVYLFFLCLVYLLFSKKEKDQRIIFVGYSLVALVVFFLPFTADLIAGYCIGENVYWRVLWLLPLSLAIAYVCTQLCTARKNGGMQMILGAVLLGVIILGGNQVYVADNFQMPDNQEKVPYEAKLIADLVREDAGDGRMKLVAPEQVATYLRVYAPDIKMPYGRGSRGARGSVAKQLHILLNRHRKWEEPAQIVQVTSLAHQAHCNYLVVWLEDEEADQEYENNGYSLIGILDQYHVYRSM